MPVQAEDEEYEQVQEGGTATHTRAHDDHTRCVCVDMAAMRVRGPAIHDWFRLIKSLPEWPYLFVLDTEGKLLSRQTTGPLERYERYDHHTVPAALPFCDTVGHE